MMLILALLACTSQDAEEELLLPTLDDGWTEIQPGGDTICSRGDEFGFFVHPGTVNKVVLEFQGGGACWDELTCGFAGSTFSDDMDWMRDLLDANNFPGIYDHEDELNPFKDWYHVLVPYCTGDIHWGDSTTTYGEGADAITIEHKGAVNARAALDWIEENFSGPEQILSTGCSAGAYGSIMWAPYLQRMFPDARTVQFGDSGAGVITSGWFAESFPSWNPDGAFPAWIPTLDPATTSYDDLALPDLYQRIGEHYPDMTLTQFNTILDWNQAFYYEAMGGGSPEEWSLLMQGNVDQIVKTTPNFRYFMGTGDEHCIIPYDDFYSVGADGVQLTDWLSRQVAGEDVDNVTCEECPEIVVGN